MREPLRRSILLMVSLMAFLPAFTDYKVADLQSIDVVLLGLLFFCLSKFVMQGFRFRVVRGLRNLTVAYALLICLLVALAVAALRMPFFPLDHASLLKHPLLLSMSRLAQLASMMCGFLWLANAFLRYESLLEKALRIYWVIGVIGCWLSIFCYLILVAAHLGGRHILLLAAYSTVDATRARGFFVEGGPYGLYLVSVFLCGLLWKRISGKPLGSVSISVLSIAFVLSASKAGFLAAAVLMLYWLLSGVSLRLKLAYGGLAALFLGGAVLALNIPEAMMAYVNGYQTIEQQIALRPDDPNLVMGRIANLFIIPRMIEQHPITGIGYGNYPLMRNNPKFLGSLPAITEYEDLNAIGMVGVTAETGIPAILLMSMLICAPYWKSRKDDPLIALAGLFQPIAYLFGVQLTFFYPWFVSACVLALADRAAQIKQDQIASGV